jgi:EAL domain-containing protein (putative c-di-GMP-specific phosphodiesterase class I)
MSATSPSTRLLTRAQLEAAGRALGTGGAGATQLLALLYDPDVEVELLLVKAAPERMAAFKPLQTDAALADAAMPASALQLEITEREVSRKATGTRELMQALRKLRVKLAMDDFGTGASSLGCLREFPFDTIKIDKSFVTDLCNDPHVLAVAHATVNVIENLGMLSVAEGVEEPGELATLQSLGCRFGQGWLCGRPMAPAQLLPSRRAG